MKIKSKKIKNKFIYGDLLENKKANTLVIFLSGFSGSRELPLFKDASAIFLKNNFSTLKFNFCGDSDDKKQEFDALNLEEMSFSVYIEELKNIVDFFDSKYSRIVLIGHSFGAVVSILFLHKYKKYKKNTSLVLWDPSLLPWKKEWMLEDFILTADKKNYCEKVSGSIINKVFYKELITINTVNVFSSLNKKTCIIAAKNSADKDAKKYFSKIKNKKTSELFIIKNTDHFFKGKKAKKELFEKTMNFLNEV
ncbi:MAG: alpha/beta hydrolase [Candidatus Paceibacterota bacterium]|jgi:alpha/beta superfamily hydrolase